MSAELAPETVRFNAVDRYYLISETDDPHGAYFPMLVCGGVQLTQRIECAQIVEAFKHINARFPAFRLAYELDYTADRWRKVADLDAHFEQMAAADQSANPDEAIASAVRANLIPFSCPLRASIDDDYLTLRIHHGFADGLFGVKLLAHLIVAVFDPNAYDQLPDIPLRYGLPIWRVAWDRPQQGFTMLWNWIRTFKSSVDDYKGTGEAVCYTPEPIHNGSPIAVQRFVIPRASMKALRQARRALSSMPITLNTLCQVMVAHRLIELGILPQDRAVEYTQPIDLKRYKKDPYIYAGNLAGQIRLKITPRPTPDLSADCVEFQTKLETQLKSGMPLSTLPSEWLLALMGRRFYKKINRDWITSSIRTDRRFFVFSNLGVLDADLKPALPFIAPESQLALAGSLIGAPPLLITLGIVGGIGHLTMTYNPRVLDTDTAAQIAQAFTPEWSRECSQR